jgi:hypothetical protein
LTSPHGGDDAFDTSIVTSKKKTTWQAVWKEIANHFENSVIGVLDIQSQSGANDLHALSECSSKHEIK